MGIANIIKIAIVLTVAASLTVQLPRVTRAIQVAQIKLLKESEASKWGSPESRYSSSRIDGLRIVRKPDR